MKAKILKELAYARSGDKGSSANIGVIAYTEQDYRFLCEHLTADRVGDFFKCLAPRSVKRYELPNLWALNFVLTGVLDGGGSRSLRETLMIWIYWLGGKRWFINMWK